ncbi:hypothetical protein CCACVL1_08288 [Corchorus capsularis]|uniref:Uncharacterized protein n=1 Tax=Corchorus capsularis TaxID=210143 RepID=A0A1R3J1D3_COCAP|nr:hypothetical protein CCACVL1_08288 [Corchorus capsularis]
MALQGNQKESSARKLATKMPTSTDTKVGTGCFIARECSSREFPRAFDEAHN